MVTYHYAPFQSVNHGVPGSSPGGGASKKVTRNSDFFRLKSIPITPIPRFLWFNPGEGLVIFRPYSKGIIFDIFVLCQECAKICIGLKKTVIFFLKILGKRKVFFI
jgi:hypothetical protein